MKKFFAATMAAFFVSRAPAQPAPVQSGIMAILDSFYTKWSAEIGWVQKFIDYPPSDRVSTQEHRFALLSI